MQKLLLFSLLLSACSAQPYVVKPATATDKNGKIYVVNHGWHTGLVLPAREIQARIPELKARFGEVLYIEFGWGDKGFYQANEITSGLTLRAMFWSSGSVIHAVAVPLSPDKYFANSQVAQLCLGGAGYEALLAFVENSFQKNAQGEVLKLKNGIYGDSQFYQGVGDYHLMNTCNKWTAKGLASAGLDISPTFKLTATSVMNFVVALKRGSDALEHNCAAGVAAMPLP